VSGKASRDKGNRGERELVQILHGARIRGRVLTARRVPLSGAMKDTGFGGDLLVGDAVSDQFYQRTQPGSEEIIEVKRRAQGFKVIDRWLDDAFAVCYRRDRGEWIITMRLKDLLEGDGDTQD